MTDAQRAVLQVMSLEGGELVCWPGGWWTYPGCSLGGWSPTANGGKGARPPAWHAPRGIVSALIEAGLVEPVGAPDHLGRARRVRLTAQGRNAE